MYVEDANGRNVAIAIVADGEGEPAIEQTIRAIHPRLRGTLAALEARRLASPITRESLLAIVDQWTETALMLTDRDLRLMERLARAQARWAGGGAEGAVDEIKKIELDKAWGEERTGITEWTALA